MTGLLNVGLSVVVGFVGRMGGRCHRTGIRMRSQTLPDREGPLIRALACEPMEKHSCDRLVSQRSATREEGKC